MRWVEIAINSNQDTEEAISNILLAEGCSGTAAFSVPASPEEIKLCGYLPVDDRLEAKLLAIKSNVANLKEFGIILPDDGVTVTWVEDAEWATAWKKYFKPLKLGRIVIKPTWEDYDASGDDLIIELDPGMAFGTGNHETTQLCVLALQDYVTSGCSIIDAGCGSGILAMSAAKLGAGKIFAFDNDPIAVTAAKANIQLAGLQDVISTQLAETPLACEYDADLIVANIIPNVIINMGKDLVEKTKKGGILMLSGIVENRVEDVCNAIAPLGMTLLEDRRQNDWSALVFKRSS